MEFTPVIMFEVGGQRIAVYKSEDQDYFVTNTVVGKALLCVGIDEALAVFDHCIETTFGSGLLN